MLKIQPPRCSDCKYFDYDVYWDENTDEEYAVTECDKGHLEHCNFVNDPCEDFEEDIR